VTDALERLRALADRLAASYTTHAGPRAILLVGSAATGNADAYSDLDLLLYYDEVPLEEVFAAARRDVEAERFSGTRWPDGAGYSERYYVGGIPCQVGHISVAAVERELAKLRKLDLDEMLPKIVSGLHEGLPLHGREVIERWRRRARYSERLQRAMIERHWRFFPWWYFQERLRTRDATIWRYEVLVQSAYNLVGVLAALNRVYFSTFEFKRAGKLLARLKIAPPNLAPRLDALFDSDELASTAELERLVAETRDLVAERFPDLDLSIEWGGNPTPPGARERPWS
jgi:predicted nucleotidyltransferase